MKFKKILAGVLCFAMLGASVPIGQMDIISSYADADADETAMPMTTVESEASTEEATWDYIPDTTEIEGTSVEELTGSYGDNLTYTLDSNGLLTISGTGEMDSNAFSNRGDIKSVIIEDGVTSIGDYAFACSSLTSITIPDSVTSIGGDAFWNCWNLTNITIPNSVTSIEHCAFRGCISLTSVTIPDSVTSIGDYAFEYCIRACSH